MQGTRWNVATRALALSSAVLLVAAGCGGDEKKADTPPPAGSGTATADVPPPPPSGSASAEPDKPPPPDNTKPSESLARDIIRTGRKIAYSATKKQFAYQVRWAVAGSGFGLRVAIAGEDGKEKENQVVCQPQDCDQSLDEKLPGEVKKLAAKLEEGGFVAVNSNGWASSQDELELKTVEPPLKLSFTKNKLEVVTEDAKGKPKKKALGTITAKKPETAHPAAVFLVKEAKLIAVDFAFTPGDKHELHIFKLP